MHSEHSSVSQSLNQSVGVTASHFEWSSFDRLISLHNATLRRRRSLVVRCRCRSSLSTFVVVVRCRCRHRCRRSLSLSSSLSSSLLLSSSSSSSSLSLSSSSSLSSLLLRPSASEVVEAAFCSGVGDHVLSICL